MWATTHNQELEQLDEQPAIIWMDPAEAPTGCKTIAQTMKLWYNRQTDGKNIKRKACCDIRGEVMMPGLHFDPANTAAYSVDKTSIPILSTLATARGHLLLHLAVPAGFTTEAYKLDKPIYVKQMARADNSLTHPSRQLGELRINLYETKLVGHI